MRPIKIVTDSCSDLAKELRDKYSIEYVKMNTVHNEKETPASLDWEYYSAKELYDIMRGGERVTTTQVPAQEFTAMFTKLVEEGFDVIYIACSGVLSGSVNTGIMVAKEICGKYPEAKIVMVSAMGQQEKFIDSIQAGAFDFIVKPFNVDRIGVVVKKLEASLKR